MDRISPEAPVPVLKIVDTYDVPGMASNVNLNLINLNISADFHQMLLLFRNYCGFGFAYPEKP